jgi:hypothetical protein
VSYLDLPRLHLFGRFFANPSTINNQTQNYDPGQVLKNAPGNVIGSTGWNPPGIALFKLDLTVQTALGGDGGAVAAGDALNGARLQSTGKPNHAKIVDLDPDQQNISQVFGLNVALTLADGMVAFSGTADTSALTDLWGRVVGGSGQGIETAGGMFQTVIRVSSWGRLDKSPALQALKAKAGSTLSIKWNLDGYNGDRTDPGFGWGRMAASIGPALAGEPVRRLAKRWMLLSPVPKGAPVLWYAPFQVDEARSRLVVDLGNSVAFTARRGGPPIKFGSFAVVLDAYGAATPVTPSGFALADYADAYQKRAGVYEFPLTSAQLSIARTRPIGVRATSADGSAQYALAEAKDGRMVVADLPFLRLDPGAWQDVDFYARVFGAPDVGAAIPLKLVTPQGATNNDPPGGLKFPGSVTTGADGKATARFTGGSTAPKAKWRGENDIDGQVYFVSGPWWPDPLNQFGDVPVSALVFDAYKPKTSPPTFWGDIQPMMFQYMRLYPGMRSIMDVSDYATLTQPPITGAKDVAEVFSLPIESPSYMPVTRDLSKAKRDAFVAWMKAGYPMGTKPTAAAEADAAPALKSAVGASSAETAAAGIAPEFAFGPGDDSIKSQVE